MSEVDEARELCLKYRRYIEDYGVSLNLTEGGIVQNFDLMVQVDETHFGVYNGEIQVGPITSEYFGLYPDRIQANRFRTRIADIFSPTN